MYGHYIILVYKNEHETKRNWLGKIHKNVVLWYRTTWFHQTFLPIQFWILICLHIEFWPYLNSTSCTACFSYQWAFIYHPSWLYLNSEILFQKLSPYAHIQNVLCWGGGSYSLHFACKIFTVNDRMVIWPVVRLTSSWSFRQLRFCSFTLSPHYMCVGSRVLASPPSIPLSIGWLVILKRVRWLGKDGYLHKLAVHTTYSA